MDELTIAFKIESPPSWLPIGRTAENNWRTVEIDCSYWFNMNANGEVVLMYKPSCGMSPYPLLTERDGDNIIWRPKSGELVEGVGRLQAFFEVGTDVIGSSDMISCEVDSSLLGADPGTDPGQTDLPWALDIIEQIAELSGHYPKIIDGDLYIWDSTLNDWVEFEASGGGAVESVNGKTGVVVLDASDVGALPDDTPIPAAVTEQTVAGWGFTKNTGTYSKPASGIPASDLASGVKTSLGKADTALQSHQSLAAYRTATAQDTIDAAQDQAISGKLSTTGNAYRSASIPMGHLDATSTATVMTATVDGITELRDGVCTWLRNGVITSASGFTLNVNGLGAKPCYSSLEAASRSTTIFNVNYTMLFIYNSTRVEGGCWDIVYGIDTNITYTPPKLGFGYETCTTAAATAAKTASISSYALTTGGIVSIKFDNDVPANATLNITSKGAKAIYHRGAAITAGVIKAGDTATFVYSTYYHLIAIDRDESGDVLPSVTASDNGKFLRVVNGAWAAQAVQTWQGGSY